MLETLLSSDTYLKEFYIQQVQVPNKIQHIRPCIGTPQGIPQVSIRFFFVIDDFYCLYLRLRTHVEDNIYFRNDLCFIPVRCSSFIKIPGYFRSPTRLKSSQRRYSYIDHFHSTYSRATFSCTIFTESFFSLILDFPTASTRVFLLKSD